MSKTRERLERERWYYDKDNSAIPGKDYVIINAEGFTVATGLCEKDALWIVEKRRESYLTAIDSLKEREAA